jgi:hypothetical protein
MSAIRGTRTQRIELGNPKVYHIPAWDSMADPKRLDVIAQIIDQYGRDPRIAEHCVQILREAGVQPRDYTGQEAALLKWVQENIYYINEPGERLQSPIYTLTKGFGDCDDMIILLLSYYHSLGLPVKLVISGVDAQGNKQRYIHGSGKLPAGSWSHIYGMVGNAPFSPTSWYFVEPTLKGVPLGWDVVAAAGNHLPEMTGAYGGFIPSKLAGSTATGVGIGVGTGAAMALKDQQDKDGFGVYMKEVFTAVVIAVVSSVVTELWMDQIRERNKARRKIAS